MSHPMIQPASWGPGDHPDQAALNLPKDRAAIYKLVWDSSLACAMKPPLLRHRRAIWIGPSGVKIVAAEVSPVAGREGYWLERADYPARQWPVNSTPVAFANLRIEGVSLQMPLGPTPGRMIQGIFDSGLTTPASISDLMTDLLGQDRPRSKNTRPVALVKMSTVKFRTHVELTSDGMAQLANWKAVGVVGRVRNRNAIVDAVESGNLSPRDGLRQLVGTHVDLGPIADRVARQIDAMCSQWQGMSREDGLLEQAKLAHKPPVRNALPSWIDPGMLLPSEHPLRQWREHMEAELALGDPTWSLLDEQVRAKKRLDWLVSHEAEILQGGGGHAFASAMDPQTGKFSAVRYWLTGLENQPSSTPND